MRVPITRRTSGCRTRRRLGVAAAFAVGVLVGAPAAAQSQQDLTQLSLEELMKVEVETVSGASRYQQRIAEAPASVSVFSGDEIVAYGCRTLSDVLQMAAGFYGTYDRNYDYVGVRGFARPGDYNTRVLILVDGHRVNDNVYDQGPVGTEFPLDMELIDRVEIIRGPNSSLYGTSALLAAINIVTRRPPATPGIALSAGGGSLGTGTLAARAGGRLHGADLLFSASAYSSDGQSSLSFPEFGVPGETPPTTHNADSDRAVRLFGSFGFQGLHVRTLYGTRKKHVPTAPYDTVFNDARLWTVDSRAYLDLQYTRALRAGSVVARAFYDHYRYAAEYPYDDTAGGTYLNRDDTLGSWGGGEAYFTSPSGHRHRMTIGGEFAYHPRRDQANFDVNTLFYHLDDHQRSSDWAAYAQDHVQVLERLAINGSIRFDHRGGLDPTVSPRLAAIVDIAPRTTVKGLYGHVYRFPNAYERYYQDIDFQKTNPALQPESVHTWEVQLDQRIGPRAHLSVGLFESRINDLIDLTEDPTDGMSLFANLQNVKARGAEVEFDVRRRKGPPILRGGWSWQWAEDAATGESLTNSPHTLAHVGAIVPLARWQATLAAGAQYVGARTTLAGATVGGAFVVNANVVRASLLPGLDVSLGVRNLFGTHYADPASIEHVQDTLAQDGRTVRAMLTWRFGGQAFRPLQSWFGGKD